jgi:hypothetical protein
MKYYLAKQGDDVVISFEQLEGQAQTVIDAIVHCRAKASACPAGVCVKIGGMETCGAGDALAVRLKPRGEAALDVASLGECLKYHLPKGSGG